MKTEKTRVVFRKWNDNEIIAIFPDMQEGSEGLCMSYMQIGQHGMCDINILRETFHAYPKEYAELKKELESIGYNLRVDNSYRNYLDEIYDGDYVVIVGQGYRIFTDKKEALEYAQDTTDYEKTYLNKKKRVVMRFPLF